MGYCNDKLLNSFQVLSVILLNCLFVDGFNIDAFNYAVYGTQQESMFGFTVAVHKQGSNRAWVLVGAPEAQSQYQGDKVRLGGVVYKCRPDGDDPCQEIPFDRDGNQFFGSREMDQKSGQWFGATLSTSGNPSGGAIVACAPRYVWYSKEMNRRDPVGTCFVSDSSFEKFEEYSPCRTSNWGYHRQGSCQAGFSAAINSIGDRLFVGAPGSYYWQGQMYSIDAHARFNYTPGLLGTTYGAKGSVHQQSLETRPAVFQTREGKQQDDDSYMGYSTIVGDFLGTGEQGIAVGMPRGAELHGKVLLFTWNLTNYKNISSSQLGSYFGYSLAAADIDGDKKLDLIVGAPMHTESNTEGKYDVGRVYVFYQGGGYGSFNRSSFLDGINSKSRFGHSVAYLGDLNLDGYEDFAVGAPYDGENNRGAVYIYYGSAKGVLEKYGQVIYAEDVVSRNGIPINTFGFSVTGGLDMDGNDYPDMAVGAYLSNSAFFFRSRPVVRVESFVRFRTENKQIDIKKKNCNLPNGQRGTCTSIDFCIKYSGKGIPQQIRFNVQYILDTKKPNIPRMAFLRKNTHTLNETITLYKDSQETCQTEEIYIKNDIRDKLTQLEAEVKYFMIQEDRDASYYGRVRNPQSQLKPVLDLNLPPSRKDSIIIQKNCGDDNICVPNLHVNVTKNVDKYLLDSNTNLEFDIIVSNFREDSFETTFDLTYPEGIYYKKTEVKEDMQGILCSTGENRTISCDIGNPLPANKIAKFRMIFVPYHKQGMSPTYEFDVHVNSSNPEDNSTLNDNYQHITVDIWVNSALDVSGRSFPQEVYLPNTTQYTTKTIDRESEIGPPVTHLYTLRNKGPATIYEAEIYFLWPWQTLAGEDLLYLLDQPHVPEGVKCEIPAPANYKNYQLDYNPEPIWERLHVDSSSHHMGHKYQSVTVESGKNITAVGGGNRISGQTSKLDEEISSSSGDASSIYEKRHNVSITESSQTGGAAGSGQDSTGHISKAGETVYTKSEWRTTIVNGQPVTKWTNVTTVKDATGKIIRTYYSTDNSNGDQFSTSSNNVDSFGQNIGGYRHKTKPTIIYTSSGNADTTAGEENLSISGRFGNEQEHSAAEEHQYEQKSISESSQQSAYGTQQVSDRTGGGAVNERKHFEEHAYTVGGGAREGERPIYSTPIYEDTQIISQDSQGSFTNLTNQPVTNAPNSVEYEYEYDDLETEDREESQSSYNSRTNQQDLVSQTASSEIDEAANRHGSQASYGGQTIQQGSVSGGAASEIDDARLRYEERRQYEERLRQQLEEQRRRLEQQQQLQTGQNAAATSYEERARYEEERRRYQEQLRQLEETRIAEEKARKESYEEQIRRQEERRRQQIDEQRRKQQSTDEELRRQQQLNEQQRQAEERRRQYELQERRRLEEERNRQRNQQQSGADSNWQQSGSASRYGGRVRTGYFDAQGVYHDESGTTSGHPGGSGVAFNHTWTVEGTADLNDLEGSQGSRIDFGQAATSGNGFRTQTIDLGMAGGSVSGNSGSRGQEQELSGSGKWVSSGQRTQGGTFSGTLEGGLTEEDRYRTEWQRNRWENEQVPPQAHNHIERDNVPTDRPDLSRRRGRRQVPELDPDIDELLKCTATRCFYLKCVVGTLKKDEFISIALRSRLNVRAVKNLTASQPLKLSSMMVARISKLPYIGKPKEQALHSHEIFTDVPAGEQELAPQVVPLWIILLSAIAGTIILLLVILLLYKCGFFKRKRPSSAPERQPLRTNGYHSGD